MPKNLLAKALKEIRSTPRRKPIRGADGHEWEMSGGMSGFSYNVQFWVCGRCGSTVGPGGPKCPGKRR